VIFTASSIAVPDIGTEPPKGARLLPIARACKKISNQGKPRKGKRDDIGEKAGAALEAIVGRVGRNLLRGYDGVDVLQKIRAAFLAHAALSLLVAARRT